MSYGETPNAESKSYLGFITYFSYVREALVKNEIQSILKLGLSIEQDGSKVYVDFLFVGCQGVNIMIGSLQERALILIEDARGLQNPNISYKVVDIESGAFELFCKQYSISSTETRDIPDIELGKPSLN